MKNIFKKKSKDELMSMTIHEIASTAVDSGFKKRMKSSNADASKKEDASTSSTNENNDG